MDSVYAVAERAAEKLDEVGSDTSRFSQEESIEFYEVIISHCKTVITAINEDLDHG